MSLESHPKSEQTLDGSKLDAKPKIGADTAMMSSVIVLGETKKQQARETKVQERRNNLPALHLASAAEQGNSTPKKSGRKDWTVGIELGATLPGNSSHPGMWGADAHLEKLKQLAKETEGKSVNFVVHAELPTDEKNQPCFSKENAAATSCLLDAQKSDRAITERYFIHDGKIDRMPDAKYKSGDQSIKMLLREAAKLSPSEKSGLLIQAHGAGADGIHTNLGSVSLKGTAEAIESGLKPSGRSKLDLLDYDACDMGSVKVLEESARVAKDVVASAAPETAGAQTDGQSLDAALRYLMKDSKISGKGLGEKIVGQARDGADGVGEESSISTLANFDLNKFDGFKQSLSNFGTALSASAKNSSNFKQIVNTLDGTIIPETDPGSERSHDRDLKDLANNVLDGIKHGKYKGDTKQLSSAAHSLVASIDNLATAQYADKKLGFDGMAGLTASVPGSEVLNTKSSAILLSPVHEISERLKANFDNSVKFGDKEIFMQQFEEPMARLHIGWAKDHPTELKGLDDAINRIQKTTDIAGMRKSLRDFEQLAERYDKGPVGDATRKSMLMRAKSELHLYLKMTPKIAPGWDEFVKTLISSGS